MDAAGLEGKGMDVDDPVRRIFIDEDQDVGGAARLIEGTAFGNDVPIGIEFDVFAEIPFDVVATIFG